MAHGMNYNVRICIKYGFLYLPASKSVFLEIKVFYSTIQGVSEKQTIVEICVPWTKQKNSNKYVS
jgi:hypothetical protein